MIPIGLLARERERIYEKRIVAETKVAKDVARILCTNGKMVKLDVRIVSDQTFSQHGGMYGPRPRGGKLLPRAVRHRARVFQRIPGKNSEGGKPGMSEGLPYLVRGRRVI